MRWTVGVYARNDRRRLAISCRGDDGQGADPWLRNGVFSSHKIERRLHEDLALRMLGAGNFPGTARSASSVRCT